MIFFFNDTATTEIYTLSLHDALPISAVRQLPEDGPGRDQHHPRVDPGKPDRKSTRLNSSHSQISYAVFCLKKNKTALSGQRPTLFSPHEPCHAHASASRTTTPSHRAL